MSIKSIHYCAKNLCVILKRKKGKVYIKKIPARYTLRAIINPSPYLIYTFGRSDTKSVKGSPIDERPTMIFCPKPFEKDQAENSPEYIELCKFTILG